MKQDLIDALDNIIRRCDEYSESEFLKALLLCLFEEVEENVSTAEKIDIIKLKNQILKYIR